MLECVLNGKKKRDEKLDALLCLLVWNVDFEPSLELLALRLHRGPAVVRTGAHRDDLFVASFVQRKAARLALVTVVTKEGREVDVRKDKKRTGSC